ncbi:MAG: hypothetical protein LBJ03_03755, partial [Holosporales bacterium]|nr:hypothetical protein [Holosporales bacterium]
MIAIVFQTNSAIPEKILGRFADGSVQELSLPNRYDAVRIFEGSFASHGQRIEIIRGEDVFIGISSPYLINARKALSLVMYEV